MTRIAIVAVDERIIASRAHHLNSWNPHSIPMAQQSMFAKRIAIPINSKTVSMAFAKVINYSFSKTIIYLFVDCPLAFLTFIRTKYTSFLLLFHVCVCASKIVQMDVLLAAWPARIAHHAIAPVCSNSRWIPFSLWPVFLPVRLLLVIISCLLPLPQVLKSAYANVKII